MKNVVLQLNMINIYKGEIKMTKSKLIKILILFSIIFLAIMLKGVTSYAANTAKLNVKIKVDDERFDILDNTECNIYMYLNDADGTPIEGTFSYTGDESGTITFTEGKAELILHGAESQVKFEELPEGAKYKVELRKYGCWYNEKTSSGKEGTLNSEEKTTSFVCTVNTMDQKVVAIIDTIEQLPWTAGNGIYYSNTYGQIPQPKDSVIYYTGAREVKLLDIQTSDRGYLTIKSKVVLGDKEVAVLHNIPYNRKFDLLRRSDSTLSNELYIQAGNEGYVMPGENDTNPSDSLLWAGTSGYCGEYVFMRVGEYECSAYYLAKLYARQDENGNRINEELDFDGGEKDKKHNIKIKATYKSVLGDEYNFPLSNFTCPYTIKTIGSDETAEEGRITFNENGIANIEIKANQICTLGQNSGYGNSGEGINYITIDENGNINIDDRFYNAYNEALGFPGRPGSVIIEIEEDTENDEYTSIAYSNNDFINFMQEQGEGENGSYIQKYIMNNIADFMTMFQNINKSTCIINMRNFNGKINVQKEVIGDDIDPDKEYKFKIKFEDDASDLKDFFMNNIYIDNGNEKKHLELNENFEGTFTLKAGESISIVSDCEHLQKGLPVGARYIITEEDYSTEEIETISENAEGKVTKGEVNVKFTNKKKEQEPEPEEDIKAPEEPTVDSEEEKNDEEQTEEVDEKSEAKVEEVEESKEQKGNPQTGDVIIKIAIITAISIVLANIVIYIKRKK